jgi:hypothetical protein
MFDRSEGAVVYWSRQIEASDFCGQGSASRNDLYVHRHELEFGILGS